MRHRFVSLALAILLIATARPVAAQTLLDGSFPADLPISFTQMHQRISEGFYEPASTRYRRIVVVDRRVADYVICGWLSSRNSRGVYTAFYPFGYRVSTGSFYIGVTYLIPSLGPRSRLALADFGCPAGALGL